MDGDSIPVTRSVAVPLSEIELRFSRSSGPGGQHAQKSETRVEALFDVEASSALSPAQKRRVIDRAGTVIKAVAQDERSQTRNRELAVERVVARLQEALRVRPTRRATKPTAAAARRPDRTSRRNSSAACLSERAGRCGRGSLMAWQASAAARIRPVAGIATPDRPRW